MDKAKNPMLEPNKMVAVIGYIFFTIFGGSIFVITAALIYNKAQGLNLNTFSLIELLGQTDFSKIEEAHKSLYVMSNALGNMLTYGFMLAIVGFYMRNFVKEDAVKLPANKKLFWMIPVFAVAGYLLSFVVDLGISQLVRDPSVNQTSIVELISNGGAVPMFIAVVVCAPIVEELIYRKAIFEFLKKQHIVVSYIISIAFFALPHMVTTFISGNYSILDNSLMSIPYVFSGFLLCLTYHLCDENIYASWFMHLVNNLIAFILIVVGV